LGSDFSTLIAQGGNMFLERWYKKINVIFIVTFISIHAILIILFNSKVGVISFFITTIIYIKLAAVYPKYIARKWIEYSRRKKHKEYLLQKQWQTTIKTTLFKKNNYIEFKDTINDRLKSHKNFIDIIGDGIYMFEYPHKGLKASHLCFKINDFILLKKVYVIVNLSERELYTEEIVSKINIKNSVIFFLNMSFTCTKGNNYYNQDVCAPSILDSNFLYNLCWSIDLENKMVHSNESVFELLIDSKYIFHDDMRRYHIYGFPLEDLVDVKNNNSIFTTVRSLDDFKKHIFNKL